jgi:hypothetical protein
MIRHLIWPVLLSLSCASTGMYGSDTYLGFALDVSNAPPAPPVVFDQQPDVVFLPGNSVYVVQNSDYDMFRYGSSWYLSYGGYWYRAPSYRGPYRVVRVQRIPQPVLSVPAERWKHHPHGGPPGRGRGHDS